MHHVHMNPDELKLSRQHGASFWYGRRYGSQNSIVCQVNDSEFIHSNIGGKTCMLETWQ